MKNMAASVERMVARGLGGLPPSVQTKLSGKPPVRIDGLTLHPELQLLLTAWKWRGAPTLRAETAAKARARFRAQTRRYDDPSLTVGGVRELTVDGATGPLRARHYAPRDPGRHPLLVFFHGGGFVVGDLDTHDAPCRLLCREARLHVLSVDYRLAPEHPFPAAVDDALAAFRWAARHAGELGADPSRIGVGGDSAGGNLSAVVSRLTAREGGATPSAQLLLYPVVDAVEERRSVELFADALVLEREDMHWFIAHYVPEGTDEADPRLSPLRADDVSGLSPAYVVTAGFDPLRDEGEEYARKLESAGVPTTHHRLEGFVHGFANMIGVSRASREALRRVAAVFADLVRRP